jgi:hypothetical protein
MSSTELYFRLYVRVLLQNTQLTYPHHKRSCPGAPAFSEVCCSGRHQALCTQRTAFACNGQYVLSTKPTHATATWYTLLLIALKGWHSKARLFDPSHRNLSCKQNSGTCSHILKLTMSNSWSSSNRRRRRTSCWNLRCPSAPGPTFTCDHPIKSMVSVYWSVTGNCGWSSTSSITLQQLQCADWSHFSINH